MQTACKIVFIYATSFFFSIDHLSLESPRNQDLIKVQKHLKFLLFAFADFTSLEKIPVRCFMKAIPNVLC